MNAVWRRLLIFQVCSTLTQVGLPSFSLADHSKRRVRVLLCVSHVLNLWKGQDRLTNLLHCKILWWYSASAWTADTDTRRWTTWNHSLICEKPRHNSISIEAIDNQLAYPDSYARKSSVIRYVRTVCESDVLHIRRLALINLQQWPARASSSLTCIALRPAAQARAPNEASPKSHQFVQEDSYQEEFALSKLKDFN